MAAVRARYGCSYGTITGPPCPFLKSVQCRFESDWGTAFTQVDGGVHWLDDLGKTACVRGVYAGERLGVALANST